MIVFGLVINRHLDIQISRLDYVNNPPTELILLPPVSGAAGKEDWDYSVGVEVIAKSLAGNMTYNNRTI